MEENRDFKGLWIPAAIWLNPNLSAVDKCLLAEIASLDNYRHCFATNAYFAEFLGISTRSVSQRITALREMGLIRLVSTDGRRHVRASCIEKSSMQGRKNFHADTKKVLHRVEKSSMQDRKDFHHNNKDINKATKTDDNTIYPAVFFEKEIEAADFSELAKKPLAEVGAHATYTAAEFWKDWHALQNLPAAQFIPRSIAADFARMNAAECEAVRAHLPKYIAATEQRYRTNPTRYISEQIFLQAVVNRNPTEQKPVSRLDEAKETAARFLEKYGNK